MNKEFQFEAHVLLLTIDKNNMLIVAIVMQNIGAVQQKVEIDLEHQLVDASNNWASPETLYATFCIQILNFTLIKFNSLKN